MAILACLSRIFPAVGASQPLPVGIVDNRILKNSIVAWGADPAALLNFGICVFTRGDIIQWSGKELVAFERSAEFIGKCAGFVGEGKSGDGIEIYIPDFVAEIAGDAFGFDSLN
jgi:hypothetical protein